MLHMRSILVMLVVGLASAFLVPSAAHADPTTQAPAWTTTLSHAPERLYSSPDGTVSGSSCSASAISGTSVSQASGSIVGEIPNSSPNGDARCILEHAVDSDGVSYVIERNVVEYYTQYAYAGTILRAYKNNSLLWTANLGTCQGWSSTVGLVPQSLKVGYDGGVYVIGTALEQCSQTDRLMKVDKRTGEVKYQIPLVNTWTDGSWLDRRMAAYSGGLAIADTNKVRYFKYDGTEDTTKTVTYHQMVINFNVAVDGSVVLAPIGEWGSCPSVTHNPGSASVANVTHSLGVCDQSGTNISPLPNSKFAYQYFDSGTSWSGNYNVKVFGTDGSVVYNKVVTPNGESGLPWNTRVVFDASGKAVVVQNESNGKLSFEVFGTTGVSEGHFEADGVTTAADKLGPVSLANGAAYVTLCNTSCAQMRTGQGSTLYKFDIAGLTPDYPRGQMLYSGPEKLKYVALGDSFSSGEGVVPYFPGTDVEGANMCRRSVFAYSMQVEQAKSLEYNLSDFRACSGATTWNVQNGQNGESAQLSSLTSGDADVVTLTVGGNDVDFRTFATACVSGLCDMSTSVYNATVDKINTVLPNVLPTAYSQILANLPANGDLYVLGYPHVAPVKTNTDLPIAQCSYLYDGNRGSGTDIVQDPWGDARAAYDVTVRINAQIEDIVYNIKQGDGQTPGDERIHFVDVNGVNSPFIDRDVCASDPYFFNLNTDLSTIFHPNQKGHQALAEILISKL